MKYRDINITWKGDITSYSGTAQYARALLKPIILGGASIRIEMQPPIKPECELDPWWVEQFKILARNSPGELIINCGPLERLSFDNNKKNIVLTNWESKNVPVNSLEFFKKDEIIHVVVPNESLVQNAQGYIDKPVSCVKMPIDIDTLNKVDPLEIAGIDNSTVLLGCTGEWNNRKNLSDIVVAYLKAFTDKDNVALVLKTFANNAQDLNERKKLLELVKKIKSDCKRENLPKIIILQEVMSYNTINSLFKRINIYVCSSRGESKNISLMKSLGMGKQTIFCNHSGNSAFTNKDNINILNIPFVYEPIILDKGLYNISDCWARIDCETLSKLMNESVVKLLQNATEIKEAGKKNKNMLRQEFNVDKEVDKLVEIIRQHQTVPVIQL